jgi:hypothetical protein
MASVKYSGPLTYSGLKHASVVKSLQFIGSDWLALDVTEKREDETEITVRLLGIAERQSSGAFRTPWIYLASPTGEDLVELDEPYAQLTLTIVEAGVDQLQVVGQWHEWGDDPYEFSGRLQRTEA